MRRRTLASAVLALVLLGACETHLDGTESGVIWIDNGTGQQLTLEHLDGRGDVIRTQPLRAGGSTSIGTGSTCSALHSDIVARGEDGSEVARLGGPPCSRDIWTLEGDGPHLQRHRDHQ